MTKLNTLAICCLLLLLCGLGQSCRTKTQLPNSQAGILPKSEKLYLQALAAVEQNKGDDHPDLVPILAGLADLYQTQARFSEAERHLQRAMAIAVQHDATVPDHTTLTVQLAGLYKNQGLRYRAIAVNPIASVSGAAPALMALFDDWGSFPELHVDPQGGPLLFKNRNGAEVRVGANLPTINNLTWSIESSDNRVEIAFTFAGTDCPTEVCSGRFCMTCTHDGCNRAITLADTSLGLNNDPAGIGCAPPSP